MRGVSLKELAAWVKKNADRTWHWKSLDMKTAKLEIKYLNFSLDTRTMDVWSIKTSGAGKDYEVFIRDDNGDDNYTILDELEKQLNIPRKEK